MLILFITIPFVVNEGNHPTTEYFIHRTISALFKLKKPGEATKEEHKKKIKHLGTIDLKLFH